MNTREARLLFSARVLEPPVIRKSAGGWMAELPGNHGLNPVLERARGGAREFKTLDAAAEQLFEFGFTAFTVERSTPP